MDATNNVKAATISRLMTANVSTVRPGLAYWREASHRPLHGIPADAPFHLPDPALPLSWPFANAPPIETRTIPSRPMLPVTSAPGAETLPSATVSVERVEGSHAPALVTMVTLQSPSYGVWAVAGAAARTAAAVRAERRNVVRMRLSRMNQSPICVLKLGLFSHNVFKICC